MVASGANHARDISSIGHGLQCLSQFDFQPLDATFNGKYHEVWTVDIYAFLLSGSLITMGAWGDRVGRR